MTTRLIRLLLVCAIAVAGLTLIAEAPADAAPCTASTHCIYGTVTDNTTGLPIAAACVTLGPPIQCTTTTNSAGFFTMDTAPLSGLMWDIYVLKNPYYSQYYSGTFVVNGPTLKNVAMFPTGVPVPGQCAAPTSGTPTQSVYLPNITKTLGGANGWVTPFIVQNTGTVNTNLEVSFYKFSDGACVARRTVSNLAPGKSFADIPNNDGDLPGDTQFSVVVRSFGASVVSTVNQVQGTGAAFQALAYAGTSSGANTVYLPNVTRRFYGWDIPFIIQNLGTATATATSAFTSIASPSCTTAHTFSKALSIDAGRSKVVDPDFETAYTGTAGSGLIDGCQYSVVVTAGQPLAVVANAHNESGAPAAYSHNALAGGAATLYAPYAALNGPSSRFSPIVVQNTGTAATTATLEFTPLGGGVARSFTTASIAAGSSRAFDPRYTNGDTTQALCTTSSTTCLGNGEYSLRITSPGTVAAVVLPVTGTTAAAYTAALQGQKKSYLPNVTRTLGGANGWTTPIVLQSTTATAVTLSWCPFSGGACTTQNVVITPLSAQWIDPRNVPGLTDDTQYAVLADGGTTGSITAIVYERNTSGGDGDMIYEGFASP
jgi:hypothetical protein